jgi:hypothetical protein
MASALLDLSAADEFRIIGPAKKCAARLVIHYREHRPMKKRLLRVSRITAILVMTLKANALVTMHGREELHCSGWSPELTSIVNHPARVSGQIGPLAPSARFKFSGDTEVFNQVLAQYAALDQPWRVLYLSADVLSVEDDQGFELSITHEGHGFLHLRNPSRIQLAHLKIPKGVAVEVLPPTGWPINPEQQARLEAEQKVIEAFSASHKAAAAEAPPRR